MEIFYSDNRKPTQRLMSLINADAKIPKVGIRKSSPWCIEINNRLQSNWVYCRSATMQEYKGNIWKSVILNHHYNQKKKRNYMIISIDTHTRKFDEIQHWFMVIKKKQKTKI